MRRQLIGGGGRRKVTPVSNARKGRKVLCFSVPRFDRFFSGFRARIMYIFVHLRGIDTPLLVIMAQGEHKPIVKKHFCPDRDTH